MSEYIRTQGVELLSAMVFSLLFFHAGRLYERMKNFKRELEKLRKTYAKEEERDQDQSSGRV